jgi:hypothetical protein
MNAKRSPALFHGLRGEKAHGKLKVEMVDCDTGEMARALRADNEIIERNKLPALEAVGERTINET